MITEHICNNDIEFLLAEISDDEGGLTELESDCDECVDVDKDFDRILQSKLSDAELEKTIYA